MHGLIEKVVHPVGEASREGEEIIREIHELVVVSEDRAKGIGKALVQRALNYFREKTLKKVGLWAVRGNKRAKVFYAHLGFRERGIGGQVNQDGEASVISFPFGGGLSILFEKVCKVAAFQGAEEREARR